MPNVDMSAHRLLTSPLLVFVSGLATTILALALVLSGTGVSSVELGRALSIGIFSAAGSASVAGLQRFVIQRTTVDLSKAEHDANHDPLTGLVNRTELYRELEVSLKDARASAVASAPGLVRPTAFT